MRKQKNRRAKRAAKILELTIANDVTDTTVNESYVYTIDEWKAVAETGETLSVEIDAFS